MSKATGLSALLGMVLALAIPEALAATEKITNRNVAQATPVSQEPVLNRLPNLPDYDFPYTDGLYATVTLHKRLKKEKPKVRDEAKVKLKGLPGFDKELKLRVLWQRAGNDDDERIVAAPLAVPLLGLGGRDKGLMARLWQSLLYKSGCHVMTFDSLFSEEFGKRSRHGVPGNVKEEAKVAAGVIDSFLKHPDVRGKVTDVRLLGMSYGGTLSLQIAKLADEGKVPIRVDRVLALSPTVNMRTAASILDSFYEEEFRKLDFDAMKLLPLRNKKVVKPGEPLPFSHTRMRAGIGYVFRDDLKKIVEKSDKIYELGVLESYKKLPKPERQYKSASKWTFVRYVEQMTLPYWQRHNSIRNSEDLWAEGDLRLLLPACPNNVHVVMTEDDPLNDPNELLELRSSAPPGMMTTLSHGGHLGYASCKWVKALVTGYFR